MLAKHAVVDRVVSGLFVGAWVLSVFFGGGMFDVFAASLLACGLMLALHSADRFKSFALDPTVVMLCFGFASFSIGSFVLSTVRTSGTAEIGRDLLLLLSFLFIAGSDATHRLRLRDSLLRTVAWTSIVVCAIGIAVYLLQPFDRFVGTFFDRSSVSGYFPNACADFFLFSWPAVWMLGRNRRFGMPMLGLIVGCLFLTFSRMSYVVLFVQLAVLFFFDRKNVAKNAKQMGFAAICALVVFVSLNFVRAAHFSVLLLPERLAMHDASGTTPLTERADFWRRAFLLSVERPAFGFGPGSFRFASQKLQTAALSVSDDPHNIVLKVAAERGWPAAALFLTLVVMILASVFHRLRRRFDPLECACALGVLGIGLHGLFDRDFTFLSLSLLFWCSLGCIVRSPPKNIGALAPKTRVVVAFSALFFLTLLFVPDTAEVRLQVAQTLIDRQDPAEASAALRQLVFLNPVDARGWVLLGDAEAAQSHSSAALALYDRALDLGGKNYLRIVDGIVKVAAAKGDSTIVKDRGAKINAVLYAFARAVLRNDHYAALTDAPDELTSIIDQLALLFPQRKNASARLRDAIVEASVRAHESSKRQVGMLW